MSKQKTFECKLCGSKKEHAAEEEGQPECCDQPMQEVPLPVCEITETAEHSRFDNMGEPCDDGRSGN
jgi:hypothetical protein